MVPVINCWGRIFMLKVLKKYEMKLMTAKRDVNETDGKKILYITFMYLYASESVYITYVSICKWVCIYILHMWVYILHIYVYMQVSLYICVETCVQMQVNLYLYDWFYSFSYWRMNLFRIYQRYYLLCAKIKTVELRIEPVMIALYYNITAAEIWQSWLSCLRPARQPKGCIGEQAVIKLFVSNIDGLAFRCVFLEWFVVE